MSCADADPALMAFCYASESLAPREYSGATAYHFFGDHRRGEWTPIQNTILLSDTLLVTGDSPELILRGLADAEQALGMSDRSDTVVIVFSEPQYQTRILSALRQIGVTAKFVSTTPEP